MRFNDALDSLNGKGLNGNHPHDLKAMNGNGSHNGVIEDGSETSSFAMLGPSTPKSSYQGHDREEVTRILMQALSDMGYHKAASTLESESEYALESQDVSQFKIAVLQGDWRKAERLLLRLSLRENADAKVSTRTC
jgi:WD repeat-containing protein 26